MLTALTISTKKNMIRLTIDKKTVEVEPGTTILKAARRWAWRFQRHFELCDMGIENKPWMPHHRGGGRGRRNRRPPV